VIGEFQAVKHRLADDYVGLERARSLTAAAATELDSNASGDGLEALSRMAKAAASEAAMTGVRDAIQVLGAMGITSECELPWLLRRARVGSQLLGDARHHYAWLGSRPPEEAR
jgi:alkylation response protein AidB-like acyl-CoA dehydrogenase